MTAHTHSAPRVSTPALAIAGILGLVVLWAYLPTLATVVGRWGDDPRYSHGYLVPLFAIYLLWLRRNRLNDQALPTHWLGLALVGVAVGLRLFGTRNYYEYLDQISLLPCLAGLLMLAGGWSALSWGWPAVAFLAFMIPLPFFVEIALSGPMQGFATIVSTFVLQVVGRPALAEGNVILLNDIELNIVEACSGLRMLVVFFALSTAVAVLMKKPLWERFFIASSAVPIALIANVLRITITGLCYDTFGNRVGGQFFHDAAGWLMMPLGLALLVVEMWMLNKLLIDRPSEEPTPEVILTRVAVNPVALYQGAQPSKREKQPTPAPTPPVAEVAVEEAAHA